MDLKELGAKIAALAPNLGAVVGGPIGALAGSAVKIIAEAFGLKAEAKPEEIAVAIQADPEAALKLKMAEMDFKVKLQELALKERDQQIQELDIRLKDIQSARGRQVEHEKATGKRDINLYVLAWVIMGGFIGIIGCMVILQVSFKFVLQPDPLLTLLLGSLSTDAGLVVGYFFGTSMSSHEKTKLLAEKTK